MTQADASCTGTVYHRTDKGQALAGKLDKLPFDQDFRRLLLMVNGFTPLETIASMARFDQQAQIVAGQLEAKGLIERSWPYAKRHMAPDHSALFRTATYPSAFAST
jgi:hypothetical protein